MKIPNFYKIKFSEIQEYNHTPTEKVKFFFLSYIFAFIIMFIVLLLITMPMDFFVMKVLHFDSIKKTISPLKSFPHRYPFYLVVFISPFFEEILFRLALILNKKNISIFIGLLVYVILGGKISTFSIGNSSYIYFALIGLAISSLTYFYLPQQTVDSLRKHCTHYLIKFSILFFGLIHIANASVLHWELSLFYPFFVLPQIIMGYFITNLRLKYGFWWGYALHVLFNAIGRI